VSVDLTKCGRFWRFALVGLLNTLVDFGLFNLLVLLIAAPSGAALLACNAAAFLAANLCSYVCNRSWTFASTGSASLKEYSAYFGISLVGLLLNSLALWLLTGGSGGVVPAAQPGQGRGDRGQHGLEFLWLSGIVKPLSIVRSEG
jgi:putative flippase GtrA